MSAHWVCIHGHFYQPPRENPWLEAIEPQPSARPYHDWNERITAECYRPNAAARVVDHTNQIIDIVDNYQRMSFNVGPTLMAWLAQHAPDVHTALVAADRASAQRFAGHGSAIAQAYNHLIMPLASDRDRATQVRWGIADFVHRFGRAPEGMWLPECAVDTASLEALAAEGIAFTILAPHQARAWRPPGGAWRTTPIDPGRAYRCPLPSGRSIDLFFYDGATSRAVAFERLLVDGHQIVARMIQRGPIEGGGAALCHIATDGETFGHHHRYGDMGLAWALSQVESGWRGTRLTNYGAWRAAAPATWEVQLAEDTAWSCAHGIGRWRDDCGCNSGGKPGWNQRWRRPLRDALDGLRARVVTALDELGGAVFHDPWAARDGYIAVVLARTPAARDAFLATHARGPLAAADRVRALSLMELARHAMLMYTSCGWFFDDLSGIETVQCLQYAARAAELLDELTPADGDGGAEAALINALAAARSNLDAEGDGREVWQRRVATARIAADRVCEHVAVCALLEPGAALTEVAGYHVELADVTERRSGRARLVAGTVRVQSQLTEATTTRCFAGLHLGEHHVTGGVRPCPAPGAWSAIVDELAGALRTADVFAAQRALERHFPGAPLALSAVLPGRRAHMVDGVLADALATADAALGAAYDTHAPLIRWLVAHRLPVPDALHTTAATALRRRVLVNLRAPDPSLADLRALLAEATEVEVDLDTPEIALAASDQLHALIDRLTLPTGELDPDALDTAARAAEIAARMRSGVDLWFAQNATFRLLAQLPALRAAGDTRAVADLERLARALRLRVAPPG